MTRMDKVLIVRLGALGDILHALPAQQLLHTRLPGATIDWLAEPHYIPLLRCVPGIRKAWSGESQTLEIGFLRRSRDCPPHQVSAAGTI